LEFASSWLDSPGAGAVAFFAKVIKQWVRSWWWAVGRSDDILYIMGWEQRMEQWEGVKPAKRWKESTLGRELSECKGCEVGTIAP
jgi:hypothetical protein